MASPGAAPGADLCTGASVELTLHTGVRGDHVEPANGPPDGVAKMLDVSAITNNLLAVPILFSEPLLWKKACPNWDPVTHSIHGVDLGCPVDVLTNIAQLSNGAFTIRACS